MRNFIMLKNPVYGKGFNRKKFLEISHAHSKHRFNHSHSITKKHSNHQHEYKHVNNKSRLKPLSFKF